MTVCTNTEEIPAMITAMDCAQHWAIQAELALTMVSVFVRAASRLRTRSLEIPTVSATQGQQTRC